MKQAPRKVWRAAGLLGLLAFAGALAAAENGDAKGEEVIAWPGKVVPGPEVILRLHRTTGKFLIYEGVLKRTQKSSSSYDEDDKFYLNMLCADQKDGRALLALWRTFTNRKRVEKLANGKTIDRILDESNDLLDLGPNSSLVGTTRCYAYDAQNQLAFRTGPVLTLKDGRQYYGTLISQDEQKVVFLTDQEKMDLPRANVVSIVEVPTPHFCLGEAPHYLFPIFSEHPVAPGKTWRFRMPLLMPIPQGSAAKVLPTQFYAAMTGRLRCVRDTHDGPMATVDYHVNGIFDSDLDEYKARLPNIFADSHFVHKLTLDGTVTVDVNRGRIVTKTEDAAVLLYAGTLVPQEGKPAKLDENKAEISSHLELKLLPPGTKLRSGAVVPPYE